MLALKMLVLCTSIYSGDAAEKPKPRENRVARQKADKDEKVQDFISSREKKLDQARAQFLKAAEKLKKSFRNDAIALKKLEDDLDQMEKSGELPTSDELLLPTYKFALEVEELHKDVHDFQKKSKVDPNDPLAVELTSLETKLSNLVARSEKLEEGSKWRGTRNDPQHAFHWTVTIDDVAGNVFTGNLHQHWSHFEIKGERSGHHVRFATTNILRGPKNFKGNRQLRFEGIMINDRMIGIADGINSRAQPIKNVPVALEYIGEVRKKRRR